MNPVFWFFVLIVLFNVWIGLRVLFRPVGRQLHKLYTDTNEIINKEDEEKENEK